MFSLSAIRGLLHCAQVPGNIRRAEHFCSFLRQLVTYMRERISVQAVEQESCTAFLAALQEQMSVDGAPPRSTLLILALSMGGANLVIPCLSCRMCCDAAQSLLQHLSRGLPRAHFG